MKLFLKKIIKLPVLLLYHLFMVVVRVDKKLILFESNLGRNYSGNPRFIYEEMVAKGLDEEYCCYYILENLQVSIPGKAKKVKRISIRYFYLFAKAGVWVSDTRMPKYLRKRKQTVYIQTWHGTPLKKLALDMEQVTMEGEKSLELYKKNFAKNTATWDYLISQNAYSTKIFKRAFAYQKDILEIGYPRNDILVTHNSSEAARAILQRLNLPADKKVILYAPTWRDHEHYGHLTYKFSTGMDYSYLQEQLSADYILLVKAHYLVGENRNLQKHRGFLYQFDASYDIAELYLAADLLITDYSSVMFDYSLLRRPMFFYAYDLEEYKDQLRGFYFDFIEEAPGPIVTSTKLLVDEIRNYKFEHYEDKYRAFCEKYNHADSGEASKKVVDLILSLQHGGPH